ncbi:hypothetical protein OROHE_005136 [Orobanche hederae]
MSLLTEKKKQKKASKPKAKETVTAPVIVDDLPLTQPADHQAQSTTPAVKSFTFRSIDPEPTASMMDHHIFAGLENLDESATHIESIASSPERVPIPEQDPTLNRVPSPSLDPTTNRVPTPVRDSSPVQAPIPIEDPVHTVNPIPVRSPSPLAQAFSAQVEQAFARFVNWKSYRTAPYDILFNWKEWKEEELFVLDVTGTNDIHLLIQWNNQQCQELIFSHYLDQDHSRLKEQNKSSEVIPPVQQDNVIVPIVVPAANEEISYAIPQEESIPLLEQAIDERRQEEEATPIPLSTESQEVPHVAASSSFRCPDSPRTEARKEHLDSLGRQTVDALYKLEKRWTG